jgi:hypothetical protein
MADLQTSEVGGVSDGGTDFMKSLFPRTSIDSALLTAIVCPKSNKAFSQRYCLILPESTNGFYDI